MIAITTSNSMRVNPRGRNTDLAGITTPPQRTGRRQSHPAPRRPSPGSRRPSACREPLCDDAHLPVYRPQHLVPILIAPRSARLRSFDSVVEDVVVAADV